VEKVFVDVKALPRTKLQPPFLWILRTVVLETGARLDGGERADQAALNWILLEKLAGEILL
jgi:hypothetical protein